MTWGADGRYGIPTPASDAMLTLAEVVSGKALVAKRDFAHVVKKGENASQMHQRLAKA